MEDINIYVHVNSNNKMFSLMFYKNYGRKYLHQLLTRLLLFCNDICLYIPKTLQFCFMTCVAGSKVNFNEFFQYQYKFTINKSLLDFILLRSHTTAFSVAIFHYVYMLHKNMELNKIGLIYIHTC